MVTYKKTPGSLGTLLMSATSRLGTKAAHVDELGKHFKISNSTKH